MTTGASSLIKNNSAKQWIRVGAAKAPPGTRDGSAGSDLESISRRPGSSMSLAGSSLLGRWRTLCARRGKRLSQLVTTRCPATRAGKPRARCAGGMTSWLPYVVNASQRGGDLPAQRVIDAVPKEILKEVIGAYPEILLGACSSCLREGMFFVD